MINAPVGTPEQFAVMTLTGDRSDNPTLSNGMALTGLGSVYRQKQVYAVEVAPDRYAALVRAAFRGMNTSIVTQLQKAGS